MSDVIPAATAVAAVTAVPEVPVVPEVPAAGTAPEAQPAKTFTQAELDEILEKRLGKERRKREEDKREKEYWRQEALKRPTQPEPVKETQPVVTGEPKREAFGSYEDYLDAKAEWRAEQAVDKRLAKQREEDQKSRTASEKQKQVSEFKSLAAKVMKDVEDFEEVMRTSEARLTDQITGAILEAGEAGPQIAYHLAKNPDEAERIASLPESKQAREIVLLEVKLKAAPAKSPSKAPAPISPVGGKSGPSGDSPADSDDINAWIEKENKRVRKLKA